MMMMMVVMVVVVTKMLMRMTMMLLLKPQVTAISLSSHCSFSLHTNQVPSIQQLHTHHTHVHHSSALHLFSHRSIQLLQLSLCRLDPRRQC